MSDSNRAKILLFFENAERFDGYVNGPVGDTTRKDGSTIPNLAKQQAYIDSISDAVEADADRAEAAATAVQLVNDNLTELQKISAQIGTGLAITRINANLEDLVLLSGYTPVAYSTVASTTITDGNVRILDNSIVYAVRPSLLPYAAPASIDTDDLIIISSAGGVSQSDLDEAVDPLAVKLAAAETALNEHALYRPRLEIDSTLSNYRPSVTGLRGDGSVMDLPVAGTKAKWLYRNDGALGERLRIDFTGLDPKPSAAVPVAAQDTISVGVGETVKLWAGISGTKGTGVTSTDVVAFLKFILLNELGQPLKDEDENNRIIVKSVKGASLIGDPYLVGPITYTGDGTARRLRLYFENNDDVVPDVIDLLDFYLERERPTAQTMSTVAGDDEVTDPPAESPGEPSGDGDEGGDDPDPNAPITGIE